MIEVKASNTRQKFMCASKLETLALFDIINAKTLF